MDREVGVLIDKVSSGLRLSDTSGERVEVTASDYARVREILKSMRCERKGGYEQDVIGSARITIKVSGNDSESYLSRVFLIEDSREAARRYVIQITIRKFEIQDTVKYFLNVEGNPTMLASGQNVRAARLVSSNIMRLMMLPLRSAIWLLHTVCRHRKLRKWVLSEELKQRLKTGDVVVHNFAPDFYSGDLGEHRDLVLKIIKFIYTTPINWKDKCLKLENFMTGVATTVGDDSWSGMTWVKSKFNGTGGGRTKKVRLYGVTAYAKDKESKGAEDKSGCIRFSTSFSKEGIESLTGGSATLAGMAAWFEEHGEQEVLKRVRGKIMRDLGIEHFLLNDWLILSSEIQDRLTEENSKPLTKLVNAYMDGASFDDMKELAGTNISSYAKRIQQSFGWDIRYPFAAHETAYWGKLQVLMDKSTREVVIRMLSGTGPTAKSLQVTKAKRQRMESTLQDVRYRWNKLVLLESEVARTNLLAVSDPPEFKLFVMEMLEAIPA